MGGVKCYVAKNLKKKKKKEKKKSIKNEQSYLC